MKLICVDLRPTKTFTIVLIILIPYCLISVFLYGRISPLLLFYSSESNQHLSGQKYGYNGTNTYEVMEKNMLKPWSHRFGPNRATLSTKKKKKKSKFLQQCPVEFKKLLIRDTSLQTHIYSPSKNINYTYLKYNFWSNLISSQESQLNKSNTLINVQFDNSLMNNNPLQKKRIFNSNNYNNLLNNKCQYNGRVFGIGIYKTG
eukprot:473906_1